MIKQLMGLSLSGMFLAVAFGAASGLADPGSSVQATDFEESFRAADNAIRIAPKSPQAYLDRARLWVRKETWEKALIDINEALQLDPKCVATLVERDRVWERKGEFDRARQDFDDAVDADQTSVLALSRRAEFLAARGELDRALDAFSSSIGMNPGNATALAGRGRVWLRKNELARAFEDFDEAIRQNPKSVEALQARAEGYMHRKEYDKALTDLNQIIEIDPKFATAYSNRGCIWTAKKDFPKALDDFNVAIATDPNDAAAYLNRAGVWELKGEADKALADYGEAIRADPNSAEMFRRRGLLFYSQGKATEAQEDFSAAIRLEPKFAHGYTMRAQARYQDGDVDGAMADASEAILLDATDCQALLCRAHARQRSRQLKEALDDYTTVIRLNPDSANAFINRAAIRSTLEEWDDALSDYSEYLKINPQDANVLLKRGEMWGKKDELDKASADFEAASKLRPADLDFLQQVLVRRGGIRLRKNDVDGALDDFAAAIAPVPYLMENTADMLGEHLNDIIRRLPRYGRAYRVRGRFHEISDGGRVQANFDYNRAIRYDPNEFEALLCRGMIRQYWRQFRLAVADFSAAIRTNPKLTEAYRRRSVIHKAMGEFDLALADVEQVLRLEPADTDAYAVRAAIFQEQGKLDQASADYSRLIQCDARRYGFAVFERGTISLQTGNPQGAVSDFTEALRIAPWFDTAYFSRARAWAALGDVDKAVADLDHAEKGISIPMRRIDRGIQVEEYFGELLQKFPESAAAHLARGLRRAYRLSLQPFAERWANVGRGSRSEDSEEKSNVALPTINLAAPPRPARQDDDVPNEWEPPYPERKRELEGPVRPIAPEQVLEDYDAAVRLDPTCGDALLARADLWIELKERKKALDDCSAAIALGCQNYHAFDLRGITYLNMGDVSRALTDLTEAVRIRAADDQDWFRAHTKPPVPRWDDDFEDYELRMTFAGIWSMDGRVMIDSRPVSGFRLTVWSQYESRLDKSSALLCNRARAWLAVGNWEKAQEDYAEAIRIQPRSKQASSNSAWIWATAPDARNRDGKKAIEAATACCEFDKTNWWYLGLLAAAHAEAGDFSQAVECQIRALKMMSRQKADEGDVRAAEARLALYKSGRPYHQ
ncbi:MAG TPA: tetratricopeptide repeat protein [Planctomycetaceae bacterium]|jgi:tetratricopeptide (TPR) repeat protein